MFTVEYRLEHNILQSFTYFKYFPVSYLNIFA